MTTAFPRFICIQQPSGSWQVWDNAEDQPAVLGNGVLVERSFESATSACSILNRIYDGDLQLKIALSRTGSDIRPVKRSSS
ncbi:hypothetical protein HNQ96_005473 [Aminobacter lissarensis]|uniref:Uncharacterized protein n=1 Tax=Aminobacter carboxidus TaxID=376165 RepID=A0A8E2BEY8_9HYPH|nr:hypothetical protein [Aminobacter lissarensis]MBB6469583.1 hypothetical protein [Aminobacter lissarensis]